MRKWSYDEFYRTCYDLGGNAARTPRNENIYDNAGNEIRLTNYYDTV